MPRKCNNMPSVSRKKHEKSKSEAVAAVLTLLLAAVLIIAGLVMRIKLAEQNDANLELSAKLTEIEDENVRLKIEINSAYGLDELENIARNELGMLPIDDEKTVKIDVITEDKAIILKNGDKSDITDNWISSLWNIFGDEK